MNNYNILIIDDQREIVELMEIYLKNEGYNVFKAFNPMELIARVKSQLRRYFYFNETLKAQKDEKYFESNNTVMVHMRILREKIEEDPKNPEFIEMVSGGGYKIEK